MVEGKTQSGFEFQINEKIFNDWDFVTLADALRNGQATMKEINELFVMVLGADGFDNLKKHIREANDGIVDAEVMKAEFAEIKDEIKARMFNLNNAIAKTEGLNEAYQIGAAYFRKVLDYEEKPFDSLWNSHLKGLLFEYLRGNRKAKELLEKLHKAYNTTSADEQATHTDEG